MLTDPGQRRMFWETTSGPSWRGESESVPLTRAPVVIVPLAHKQAYLDRYALPDKVHTPLSNEAQWPVPYWDIDTGFGVMMILLTAVDLGLGALFFGIFAGEQALMDILGVPEGYRPIGAIAVGHPTPGERSRPELRDGPPPPRRRRQMGALVTADVVGLVPDSPPPLWRGSSIVLYERETIRQRNRGITVSAPHWRRSRCSVRLVASGPGYGIPVHVTPISRSRPMASSTS